MEKINSLLEQIVRIAAGNVPFGCRAKSFDIEVLTLRMITELNAFYTDEKGQKISFNPKRQGTYDPRTDITLLFRELRKEMRELNPPMGAWLTCRLRVESSGEFKAEYDYESRPNFADDIVDEFYLDDFKHFPRDESRIPVWMRDILQ